EEAGLITAIGHWLIRDVAMQLRDWLRQGYEPVKLALNVSTMQFHQKSFIDTVKGALNDTGIPTELLEIEVTESVLVRDYELALRTLLRLERLGVPTALDDFGTGYSSLAYLQKLPIKTLKIDRSFVQGLAPQVVDQAVKVTGPRRALTTDSGMKRHNGMHAGAWTEIAANIADGGNVPASTFPIVEAIGAVAHKLGKHVIAEGIETAYQRDFLRRLGVDSAQGYFFARPMPAGEAEKVLRRITEDLAREQKLKARDVVQSANQTLPEPIHVDTGEALPGKPTP